MRGRIGLMAVLVCAAGLAGCTYEKRVDSSHPGPPAWVVQTPEDTAGSKVFVGMGLADNILDERNARNMAMDDVRSQIAASLQTDVSREALDIVRQKGAQHLGKDVDGAEYYSEVKTTVDQAMAGVRQDDYYWEKWKVKLAIIAPGYVRYKYYVKASMPKALYERLLRGLAENVAADVERGGR